MPTENAKITANSLIHADCLAVLQRLEDQTIDLAYLDPPLSLPSLANRSPEDRGLGKDSNESLRMVSSMCQEVFRLLTPTGVLFFHTQPSLAFSVRLILNQVFGESNFRNEIVWEYKKRSQHEHDVIVHYGKSQAAINNRVRRPLTESEVRQQFTRSESGRRFRLADLTGPYSRSELEFTWKEIRPPKGRSWRFDLETLNKLDTENRIYRGGLSFPRLKVFLDENAGVDVGTVWSDILPITPGSEENNHYPTQKPLGVLERLIRMSSNEGGLVLDPFCGTGTSVVAAERHLRRWIACDISKTAIEITAKRLIHEFGTTYSSSFTLRDSDSLSDVPIKAGRIKRLAITVKEVVRENVTFVLNHPAPLEETRQVEFKEVKTPVGPVESIVNASDEYAVAFLNAEGGRIYWGIRNHDRVVVGVRLNYTQRDKVRRDVSSKINQIEPKLDPSQYGVEIHQIVDEHGDEVPDFCVVELVVPTVNAHQPYYTGGGEAWVRVDGAKLRLKGVALTEFIRNRLSK